MAPNRHPWGEGGGVVLVFPNKSICTAKPGGNLALPFQQRKQAMNQLCPLPSSAR
jgi:hypothetical protein